MDRQAENAAFVKACSYLNFSPVAKWLAYICGALTGLVYVALLAVLWIFADLMVWRARLPKWYFYETSAEEQQKQFHEWIHRFIYWLTEGDLGLSFASMLALLAFIALLLATVLVMLHYLQRTSAAQAAIEASTRMRRQIYIHSYRLGSLAFRALGPSEAISVFTRHIEAVHDALYHRLTVSFREPIKFVLILIFCCVLSLPLALAFFLATLLVWTLGSQAAAYYRRQIREGTNLAGEHLTVMRESLNLMRLVKCYLMEEFNRTRVERQLSAFSKVQLDRYRSEAFYQPLLLLLGLICLIVLLGVAGVIILLTGLNVARVFVLAVALLSLYQPLQAWMEERKFIRRGRDSAIQFFRFLERRGDVAQVVGAEFLNPLKSQIEFDNVSLREPGSGRMLLEEVSLTIKAGQRVAIVGADELEKQALVYLLPRLLDPSVGEIRIDDHNLRLVTLDSLRLQIATILQKNLVFHDTVGNNIGCGDKVFSSQDVIAAAKMARAHHFIQKLPKGYDTIIGEQGHSLTIGEQFRISLARVILRNPTVLIIEEPAIALDEETKDMLDDTLSRLLPGRTVIFLPHRISTLRSCNQIFLLSKGRVVATADHKELLATNRLYRHLHYLEFNEVEEV